MAVPVLQPTERNIDHLKSDSVYLVPSYQINIWQESNALQYINYSTMLNSVEYITEIQ